MAAQEGAGTAAVLLAVSLFVTSLTSCLPCSTWQPSHPKTCQQEARAE